MDNLEDNRRLDVTS